MDGRETEAKFYLSDLEKVRTRLHALKARLIQERVLERNTRFDLPGARLRAEGRVLRLRQDTETRLTYKGPSQADGGTLSRQEVEFTVGDFDKARQFLEGLGYRKLVYYEKYRTVYEIAGAHVMLDELPYGNFVEVEGEDTSDIREAAEELGLDWRATIETSYHSLFDRVRESLDLKLEDLSFENFIQIRVLPEHLGVRPADE
jgi:adenylate cyclase, class 2